MSSGDTWRDRLLSISGVVFGAMWLFASVTKVVRPEAVFEVAVRAVPAGAPAKVLLAAAIGIEAGLGVAMCLRAIRGLWPSLVGLALVTAVLFVVRAEVGDLLPCGCFGGLFGATLAEAAARNGWLAAVHVAVMLLVRRGTTSPRT